MDFERYAEAMFGPMYRDRVGNPITMGRWMDLKWDYSYAVVSRTVVGSWVVSTIWMGVDHNFLPGGVPMIFETMVFELAETQSRYGPLHKPMFDDFQARYSTERQAREGHEATVREVRKLFLPAVIPDMSTERVA